MPSRDSFIPKTPSQRFFNRLQDVFMFAKQVCLLPLPFYLVKDVIQSLQSTFPLLLFDINDIWRDSEHLNTIVRFFQVFYRFGSICQGETEMMISFIFIIAAIAIFLIPTVIGFFSLMFRNSFSNFLAHLICISHEIFLEILHFWLPSQIATILSKMITDSTLDIFLFFQLIILTIFLVGQIFFNFYFLSHESIYAPGRNSFWDSSIAFFLLVTDDIILFLTRLMEKLDKTVGIVCFFIILAICVFKIIMFISFHPFIVFKYNLVFAIGLTVFTLCFILLSASHFIGHIHIMIIILITMAALMIVLVGIPELIEMSINRDMNKLDMLSIDEISLNDAVKYQYQFLHLMRIGFLKGHGYIFTWKPFEEGLIKWPNSHLIYYQYMKFVAIYYQENQLLNNLIQDTKPLKGYQMKLFRKEMKIITESRNRHFSSQMKKSFLEIDDEIKSIKSYLVTYWTSIRDNMFDAAFDVGKQLETKISSCHSLFQHLILLYPNNSSIPLKYAEFLQTVICDPREAQYWIQRASYLGHKNTFLFDIAQNYGFKQFQAIPKILNKTKIDSNPPDDVASQISSTIDSKSQISSRTNLDIKTQKHESLDIIASIILSRGKKAPIRFVAILIVILLILCIVSIIQTSFVPLILFSENSDALVDSFSAVKIFSSISNTYSTLSFYLLFKSALVDRIIPNKDQLNAMIGIDFDFKLIDEIIQENIRDLNKAINNFQHIYGQKLATTSSSGKYIYSLMLPLKFPNFDNISSFNLTYFQAINTLTANAFRFTIEQTDYPFIDQDWMIYLQMNYDISYNHLFNILIILTKEMSDSIKHNSFLMESFFISIITINTLLTILFIIFALRIRSHWNYIIKTINTLPRVAFQKVITKNSKDDIKIKQDNAADQQEGEEREKMERSELKYQNLFVQMVGSRGTSARFPVPILIVLIIINLLVLYLSTITIYILYNSFKSELESLPLRYSYPNRVSVLLYHMSNLFLRRIMIDQNKPFVNDNITANIAAILNVDQSIAPIIDILMFGTSQLPEIGLLSINSMDLHRILFDPHGSWIDQALTFARLNAMPHYLAFEILSEFFTLLEKDVLVDTYQIDIYDSEFWSFLRFATNNLKNDFIEPINDISDNKFYSTMSTTKAMINVCTLFLLFLTLITFSALMYQLVSIRKTVHFTLSSLSMIEYEYIQEMNNILDLFSGVSSGVVNSVETLNDSMMKMVDVIQESIIELNADLHIVDANSKMADWLNLKIYQIVGSRLNSIIQFPDKSIERTINQFFSSPDNNGIQTFDSEIKLVQKNINERKRFDIIHFRNNNQNTVLLFFKTSTDTTSMRNEIADLNTKIADMEKATLPSHVLKVMSNHKSQFNAHYVTIIAIEVLGMKEYLLRHSSAESKKYFNDFTQKIDKLCDTGDRIRVMNMSGITIVAFNLIKQIPNYFSATKEAIAFINEIHDFSNKNNYTTRFSAILSKSAIVKRNGIGISFYAKKLRMLITMLHQTDESCLSFSSKLNELLPRRLTKDAIQLRGLNHFKDKGLLAFTVNLNDQSNRS